MKKNINILLLLLIIINITLISNAYAKNEKGIYLISEQNSPERKVEFAFEEDEIPIFVRNEFDEEIQVQLDTGRKYPLGSNEKITIGKRKPGKYTLTIYNKKGEFVDNITKNISNSNKWDLNKTTVSNSDKITGLSTGQKVAIAAGALGAAGLGAALINKAQENASQEAYIPPPPVLPAVPSADPSAVVVQPPVGAQVTNKIAEDNAFASGGKAFKFLNTKYDQITLIVEGTDGNPIGANWIIPKGSSLEQPKPLMFNGEKITIGSDQKINVIIPDGFELQRYAFEFQVDPDGSYTWIIR